MSTDPILTFSGLVKRLITDLRVDLYTDELGIQRRTVLKIRDGASSAKHEHNARALWEGFREIFRKRCNAPGRSPDSFSFPFEVLGEPGETKPVDEKKKRAFIELAKRQYVETTASKAQPDSDGDLIDAAIPESGHVRSRQSRLPGSNNNLLHSAISGQLPSLSLLIHSPGEGFLCVRTPAAASLLQKRGLLPLPHKAAAQLHVEFAQPRHFCLFAFGPDLKVHAYVPHPNLPAGQARDRLNVPGDLVADTDEIPFEGAGGTESFLLLVSRQLLTKASATTAQKTLARIVSEIGAIRLPDPALPFVKEESLRLPDTKALPLSKARRSPEPLDRLLAQLRSEFAIQFSDFHFLSIYRNDPPGAGG